MYDRYYKGTIPEVEKTEIDMIRGLVSIKDIGSLISKNTDQFSKIFDPLNGKLGISIIRSGEKIYTNIPDRQGLEAINRTVREEPIESLLVNNSDYTILIQKLIPQSSFQKFIQWMTHPWQWFAPKYDIITVPFLIFIVLIFSFLYAILWFKRSKHLSDEMKPLLEKITAEPGLDPESHSKDEK